MTFHHTKFGRSFHLVFVYFIAVVYLNDGTVLGDTYFVWVNAHFNREIGVYAEHVVVAVYRDEELGSDLFVYPGGFLAVTVTGCMYVARMVGDDVCALARKVVFQLLHSAFVAGNHRRRKHHRVSRLEPDVLVRFVADASERGEFIALRISR